MYSVSEAFAEKIISDNRAFAIRLTFGSSTVLTGATVQNITLDEMVNSTDVLTMGCTCSNKVTINMINAPTDIDYDSSELKVEVGLQLSDTYEYVPLGKFYAAVPETKNDFKNLKLTAYDGFCKMTGKYNATVSENTSLQAVYDDLRSQLYSQCGITLKARTLPNYPINNFPYLDITYTQAIGYVAGCLGGFARFDRNGELEIAWYTDTTQTINRNMQYMSGFSRTTNKQLVITSLATGTSDTPIVKGSGANGTQINFENPYISEIVVTQTEAKVTKTIADDIYEMVNGLTYTPCQVKWRGNPAIQAGDMVRVVDKDNIPHNVLVMGQSLKIGGGLNATIDCKGTSETKAEFSSGFEPVGKKIERYYSTLQQAILNATNSITGNSGGYVVMRDGDNDGYPDEILIMDSLLEEDSTKCWRWNKSGLGYAEKASGNAFAEGSFKTAITADGQISADFITTGHLNANRISVESHDGDGVLTDYISFADGNITIGKSTNAITLKLENNQVAFYNGDTKIAHFSNNSFEIDNLTDGQIRFQNFSFMPRKTGNLSFTKVK